MSEQHRRAPDGGCTCNAEGFTARLSCGCETWAHGEPKPGGYITCGETLAHQSSYKVLSARPGRPVMSPPPVYVCPYCGAEDDDEAVIDSHLARAHTR